MNSKKSKNVVNNLTKIMTVDSLKIHQNEDGSFSIEWDKDDPKWSFLNGMSSKEIKTLVETAIQNFTEEV